MTMLIVFIVYVLNETILLKVITLSLIFIEGLRRERRDNGQLRYEWINRRRGNRAVTFTAWYIIITDWHSVYRGTYMSGHFI